VLGNLRFHLESCIQAFPESTLSQLAPAENASPLDWVEGGSFPRGLIQGEPRLARQVAWT
jgi:hypothetical protein